MDIRLSKYQWFNKGDIWVTGFIREGSGYITEGKFLNVFEGTDTVFGFEQILKNLNGQFSIVIKTPDEIWAATDRLRNYPLFYTRINGDFILSDDCYKLVAELPEKRFNPVAVDSFLLAGYVINNLTLIDDVFQVEAGEYIVSGDCLSRKFYYDAAAVPVVEKDFETSEKELIDIISNVFRNHFQALEKKFIAIPLSGGYDSRLIASMCSKYHPKNVLCYTYGIKGNPEVAPAREVAKRLGFKWINIVYDYDLIDGFMSDEFFRDYYHSVSNLSSMFFMQEYFAVKYLKTNKLIPDDCIFSPGFCGDMIAGSNLIPSMRKIENKNQISKVIFNEFFRLIKLNNQEESNVVKLIDNKIPDGEHETWRIFDSWDQKERQAKFNANSAKVFSFFGYEYVLPLWDNLLGDFFATLPFQFRIDKKLYDQVLTEYVFKDLDLNFSNEINPLSSQKSFQRVKERIKPFVPDKIKDLFINHQSPIFYDEITKILIKEFAPGRIKKPLQLNYYNSYLTQWYLIKTQEEFIGTHTDSQLQAKN